MTPTTPPIRTAEEAKISTVRVHVSAPSSPRWMFFVLWAAGIYNLAWGAVVLFFPLAFTSVCTSELCAFSDDLSHFESANTKVFGLSTDYNVFLISRVREEMLARPPRHANHRAAIAVASASTRKIITAAGAIMIAVFMGFATDPDPVIKMTGVGLATAVLVDVTLVRLFMAPAALTLLGDKLWPSRSNRRAKVATAAV